MLPQPLPADLLSQVPTSGKVAPPFSAIDMAPRQPRLVHRKHSYECNFEASEEKGAMLLSSCGRILRHQPPILLRDFGSGISSHHALAGGVQHIALQADRRTANCNRNTAGVHRAYLEPLHGWQFQLTLSRRLTFPSDARLLSSARSPGRLSGAGSAVESASGYPSGGGAAHPSR
jgi:hypothetical protein